MKKESRVNLSIILLAICWLLPDSSLADTYTVKSVIGHASCHDLRTGKLERIRSKQKLPVGTLIHVDEESQIELEMFDDDFHQPGDIKYLIIKSPGVIRLPGQTRVVSSGDYALKTLPKQESPLPGMAPMMNFRQAWQRLTAMLIYSEEKSRLPKVAREVTNLDISAASYLGVIEWHSPLDNLTLYSQKYPRSLDILWKADPKHGEGYKIYFWPMHQSRPPALTQVNTDRFSVTIPTHGSYFLQVTTADGRYRTSRRVIHAAAPSQRGEGHQPELPSEFVNLKSQACDMLPPKQFVIFGDPGNTPITLSWRLPETSKRRELIAYRLQILDRLAGNYIIDQQIAATSFQFVPDHHGEFSWQVIGTQGTLIQTCSAQTIIFLKSTRTDDAIDAFISAINTRQTRKILVQPPSIKQQEENP